MESYEEILSLNLKVFEKENKEYGSKRDWVRKDLRRRGIQRKRM